MFGHKVLKEFTLLYSNFYLRSLLVIVVAGFLIYKYAVPYFKQYNAKKAVIEIYDNFSTDSVPWKVLNHSENGNPVYYWKTGSDTADITLIFGAFHGDEQGGFHLVVDLARYIQANPGVVKKTAVLVPVLNPDGLLAGTRVNANNVDINRNFPTENWSPAYKNKRNYPGMEPASEIGTLLAMQLIDEYKPAKIISIHSALHVVNFDGPADALARKIAENNNYNVSSDIGYATPE